MVDFALEEGKDAPAVDQEQENEQGFGYLKDLELSNDSPIAFIRSCDIWVETPTFLGAPHLMEAMVQMTIYPIVPT